MSEHRPGCWRRVSGRAAGSLAVMAALACAGVSLRAQPALSDKAVDGRAQIQAERAAADRRLADEAADCMDRCLLTACLQSAQVRHRQAVAGLAQRQGQLDQAARRARAAQRHQRLDDGAKAAAGASAAAASRAAPAAPSLRPAAATPAPGELARPAAQAAQQDGKVTLQGGRQGSRQETARQQRAADQARRVQAAQAHRDAVLARVRREDAQRSPARPLPPPLPLLQAPPATAPAMSASGAGAR